MGLKQVKTPIGMRSSYYSPIVAEPANAHPTYGTPIDMGAAVTGNLAITTAAMSIEGDDEILLEDEKFVKGQFDTETTLDELSINAIIFGHSYNSGAESSSKDDTSPVGGYGFVQQLLKRDKSTVFRATVLYRVSAMASTEKQVASTRRSSGTEPQMSSVSYSVTSDNTGDWRIRKEFSTFEEAENFLLSILGGSTAHTVKVSVIGDGTAEPSPVTVVADGSSVTISFSAAPVAVYDNGTAATSQVSGNKLTLSNVKADHEIVVIYRPAA